MTSLYHSVGHGEPGRVHSREGTEEYACLWAIVEWNIYHERRKIMARISWGAFAYFWTRRFKCPNAERRKQSLDVSGVAKRVLTGARQCGGARRVTGAQYSVAFPLF